MGQEASGLSWVRKRGEYGASSRSGLSFSGHHEALKDNWQHASWPN